MESNSSFKLITDESELVLAEDLSKEQMLSKPIILVQNNDYSVSPMCYGGSDYNYYRNCSQSRHST